MCLINEELDWSVDERKTLAFEDNLSMKCASAKQLIARQSSLNFNKVLLI